MISYDYFKDEDDNLFSNSGQDVKELDKLHFESTFSTTNTSFSRVRNFF
jgi:hypothetical protein